MTVLYFVHVDGEAHVCRTADLSSVLKRSGNTIICPQVRDGDLIRPMTPEEKQALPLAEPFDVLAVPDTDGFVTLRHDINALPHPMDSAKWPSGRYGQSTEAGFPFKVHMKDLFPQLANNPR